MAESKVQRSGVRLDEGVGAEGTEFKTGEAQPVNAAPEETPSREQDWHPLGVRAVLALISVCLMYIIYKLVFEYILSALLHILQHVAKLMVPGLYLLVARVFANFPSLSFAFCSWCITFVVLISGAYGLQGYLQPKWKSWLEDTMRTTSAHFENIIAPVMHHGFFVVLSYGATLPFSWLFKWILWFMDTKLLSSEQDQSFSFMETLASFGNSLLLSLVFVAAGIFHYGVKFGVYGRPTFFKQTLFAVLFVVLNGCMYSYEGKLAAHATFVEAMVVLARDHTVEVFLLGILTSLPAIKLVKLALAAIHDQGPPVDETEAKRRNVVRIAVVGLVTGMFSSVGVLYGIALGDVAYNDGIVIFPRLRVSPFNFASSSATQLVFSPQPSYLWYQWRRSLLATLSCTVPYRERRNKLKTSLHGSSSKCTGHAAG